MLMKLSFIETAAVLYNSFAVYDFSCPGCSANYIGKTKIKLYERTVEHACTDNNSAVYKHLNDCTGVQNLFDIASLHSSLFTLSWPIQNSYKLRAAAPINSVQDNTEIIERQKNWHIILLKETLRIKELNPILYSGLKAYKELQLFWIHGNVR